MAVGVVVIAHGEELFVDLCDTEEHMGSMTLEELKKKTRDKLQLQYTDRYVRVYEVHFKGKLLEEDSTLLSDYGIHNMSTITASYCLSQTLIARLPFCPIRLFEEKTDDKKRRSLEYVADFEQQFEISDQSSGN
ncbi:hypothetical protein AMECASPLE_025987 [Ameca splendens]|uniref:Ubiquitin-like domain-containing protein n=1 Tax=Ameca splendens TaxID=208324 RepID=A0ABV1A193_9TELE